MVQRLWGKKVRRWMDCAIYEPLVYCRMLDVLLARNTLSLMAPGPRLAASAFFPKSVPLHPPPLKKKNQIPYYIKKNDNIKSRQ